MQPVAEDSPYWAEWDVLRVLHDQPEVLEAARAVQGTELRKQSQLRKRYSDAVVRGALSLLELRARGAQKFSRAESMWFDRVGLEQATAEVVARHKASRLWRSAAGSRSGGVESTGSGCVIDVCSGIGGDTLALAAHGEVRAVDISPVAGLRTVWNAEAYGCGDRVRFECRAAADLVLNPSDVVHIDPDRRRNRSARVVRLEDYEPPLEWLQQLTQRVAGGAIKLSPASNFGGKFSGVEIELISLSGEAKEATVWFGAAAGEEPWRATVLPAGETIAGNPMDFLAPRSGLGGYVYDPDPAVVRAGLVDAVAERLNLARLDEAEEYLTADALVRSPFVQAFEVLADLPNNDREIRAYFRQSAFGQVEIKCRHIPIDAEGVRRKLELPGDEPGVLLFARVDGRARACIARRV